MGLPVPATERANEIMDAAPLRPQHQSDDEAMEHIAGTLREQSRIWGAPGGYPGLRGRRRGRATKRLAHAHVALACIANPMLQAC